MLLAQLYELLTVDLQQLKYNQLAHLFLINHQTQPLEWTGGCSILNKTVDLSFCSSFTYATLETKKKKKEIKNCLQKNF